MGFTDDLKRSLGFEETESGNKQKTGPGILDSIMDILKPMTQAEYNALTTKTLPLYFVYEEWL